MKLFCEMKPEKRTFFLDVGNSTYEEVLFGAYMEQILDDLSLEHRILMIREIWGGNHEIHKLD
jgi:hypothetical protein